NDNPCLSATAERKKYNSTASRERRSACSRTKRRSTQDQPVAGGRRSRAGTRMRLAIMLGLLEVNQVAQGNPLSSEHAISDDRRALEESSLRWWPRRRRGGGVASL